MCWSNGLFHGTTVLTRSSRTGDNIQASTCARPRPHNVHISLVSPLGSAIRSCNLKIYINSPLYLFASGKDVQQDIYNLSKNSIPRSPEAQEVRLPKNRVFGDSKQHLGVRTFRKHDSLNAPPSFRGFPLLCLRPPHHKRRVL